MVGAESPNWTEKPTGTRSARRFVSPDGQTSVLIRKMAPIRAGERGVVAREVWNRSNGEPEPSDFYSDQELALGLKGRSLPTFENLGTVRRSVAAIRL